MTRQLIFTIFTALLANCDKQAKVPRSISNNTSPCNVIVRTDSGDLQSNVTYHWPLLNRTPAKLVNRSTSNSSRMTTLMPLAINNSDNNNAIIKKRRPELEIAQHILNESYTNYVMPLTNDNSTFQVRIRISLIKIQNLWERTNVKTEALEVTMRIQLNWCDDALTWDPAKFNGLDYVIIPGDRLWIPDIQIINALDDAYALIRDRRFDFKVHSDGCVWWYPTGTIVTRCELDLSYFPFDTQRCPIVFESAMYSKEYLNLTVRYDKSAISLKGYTESGQWDLVTCSALPRLNYVTKSTAFTRVEMTIEMRRKTLYYKINVFFACILLSTLEILTFLLPVGSTDRISHSVTILLSIIVFQSVVVNELPRTSNSTPLLCLYFDFLIGVSVLTVGDAIFTVYLSGDTSECIRYIASLCRRLRQKRTMGSAKRQSDCGAFAPNQCLRSIDNESASGDADTGESGSNKQHGTTTVNLEDRRQAGNHLVRKNSLLIARSKTATGAEHEELCLKHDLSKGAGKARRSESSSYGFFSGADGEVMIVNRKNSSVVRSSVRKEQSSTTDNTNNNKSNKKMSVSKTIAVIIDNVVFFIVLTSSIVVPYYMFAILPPS